MSYAIPKYVKWILENSKKNPAYILKGESSDDI